MLKYVPAAIFFLCLTAIIINVSLFDRWDIFVVSVVVGTLAMVVEYFREQREKRAATPAPAEQLAHWQTQWAHISNTLASARANGDDRVPFLESQLAEAERELKKLGAAPK